MLDRRTFVASLACAAATGSAAAQQPYPTREVNFIVPGAPAAPTISWRARYSLSLSSRGARDIRQHLPAGRCDRRAGWLQGATPSEL